MEKFRNALVENGILILNYPSLAAFSGIHDISVGIKSRTNISELKKILEKSGFEVCGYRYWPFLLSPIIFSVRLFQRIKLKTQKNVSIDSDVSTPGKLFNTIFYWMTRSEALLGVGLWGSSLFIVARKKNKF